MRMCEVMVMDIEEADKMDTWTRESAEARQRVGTARAVLEYALKIFPDRKEPWRRLQT